MCIAAVGEGGRLVPYSSGSGLYTSGDGSADGLVYEPGSGEPPTTIPTESGNEGFVLFLFWDCVMYVRSFRLCL